MRADFDNYNLVKADHAPNIAKILRPILNAVGVAPDIVDETCRLDSQVQRMTLDGALDIEVAMVDDNGDPLARETDQNRGMLYIL
jgi:hypothetical protein